MEVASSSTASSASPKIKLATSAENCYGFFTTDDSSPSRTPFTNLIHYYYYPFIISHLQPFIISTDRRADPFVSNYNQLQFNSINRFKSRTEGADVPINANKNDAIIIIVENYRFT